MSQEPTKPTPTSSSKGEEPEKEQDPIRAILTESARQGLSGNVDFEELPEPIPSLDEGPAPAPADEIQVVLLDAAQRGSESTQIAFDELPEPLPELDEGPSPKPVDEIQDILLDAALTGARTEVDFDELPEPGQTKVQKVIRFKQHDTTTQAEPVPPVEEPLPSRTATRPASRIAHGSIPPPDLPESDPMPRLADFWLLLVLFVIFRLLTLFLLRPGGYLRDWSDFDTYFGIVSLSDYGLFPFFDFWLEWPPLLPWLAVGAYKLSLWLPPWPDDPRLGFILILGSIFTLFEVGNFVLIYRLARRLFHTSATISRVLWLYTGLFPPVYAMLGFFDGIALFFMLLSLDLLLVDRRFPSAVTVGVGFMAKIIPAIMLPVALRQLWYRYREKKNEAQIEIGLYAVAFGLTVIVLLAPFLFGGLQWVQTSARSILGRSSWETVWAVAEGYYGFGEVKGDRLNPDEVNFAIHTSVWPRWVSLTMAFIPLLFVGFYIYLFTRPADYSRPRQVIAWGGVTVAIFFLASKGYSPQFLVYLLPFIILLFPVERGLIYALILTGLNILEQPVYFVLLPNEHWLLISIVIARFVVIALLALEFALLIWPPDLRRSRLLAAQRQLPRYLAGVAVLATLALLPLLLWTYRNDRLAHSPVATFVNFIEAQRRSLPDIQPGPSGKPRLLLSDQTTYRQLYPYLSADFDLQLTDGAAKKLPGAPRIVDLLQGLDTIWILPTGPQRQTLNNIVSGRGQALASFDFEGLGAASLYGFQANIQPFIAPARFSNSIELLIHEVKKERGVVEVTLYWRALNKQRQDYKVFTQLLNAQGERVAGHDGIPVNGMAPTTIWPVGAVQADTHRIELPPDLPAGEYSLITGLYNDFGARLRVIAPNGLSFANEAASLEIISLP